MGKNRLSTRLKALSLPLLGIAALGLTSCAQDGYDDDERWQSTVTNTQLASPSADDISITANADGSKTIISWPVVKGARGYHCVFTDVTDGTKVLKDSLIDGCTLTVDREEDSKYNFTITTLADTVVGNKDALTATSKDFTTLVATYATIPNGTDLAEYFNTTNPIPEGLTEDELCFDLEPGGNYTMSDIVDFGLHKVTLRSTVPSKQANVVFGENAKIKTCAQLSLKNIYFDMTNDANKFLQLSVHKDANEKGKVVLDDPILISGCYINDLKSTLFYDDNVAFAVKNFILKNTVVHFNTPTNTKTTMLHMKSTGSFIHITTIDKCTIWDENVNNSGFFMQYNGGRSNDVGWAKSDAAINISNSTFFNVVKKGKLGNYNQMNSLYTYTVRECIFVDCSSGHSAKQLMHNKSNLGTRAKYYNNTYWFDGADENAASDKADQSGTQVKGDPGFADPANGDFTVSGANQLDKKIGDPRWLK
ncbi:MAG: DUF4957 domain-containing protein [Prevotella sp.]|nr:DUF4957 domain-containing protein [Prevotella sp.]